MPWLPAAELQRLQPPLLLRAGLSWGDNLDQDAVAQGRPRALGAAGRLREQELERERAARHR